MLLMLEATIGLNEVSEEGEEAETDSDEVVAEGPFTRGDLTFLKSLRITTQDNSEEGDNADPDEASS